MNSPIRASSDLSGRISFLFLVSGATSLAYEVIWHKLFVVVWGSSALSMAAVVAAFLLGLGAGTRSAGRFVNQLVSPLRWYGYAELTIGVLAMLVPVAISLFARYETPISQLIDHALWHFTVRLAMTFFIIGPLCFVMGSTLPLLVRHFEVHGRSPQATAWLYAVNTIGASAGCYLAGFHLLPWAGLWATNLIAIALNISVGFFAILYSRPRFLQLDLDSFVENKDSIEPLLNLSRIDPDRKSIYAAAFISGFAALLLQMVWARQLSIILGSSTYSFSAALCVILAGIGIGSFIYQKLFRELETPFLVGSAIILGLICFTIVGKLLLPTLCQIAGVIRPLRSYQPMNAMLCIILGSVLEFLPAVAMGALFPMLVNLARRSNPSIGAAIGSVYSWNMAGSIAGAACTSVLLIPVIGSSKTVALALSLYVLLLLLLAPVKRRRELAITACLVLLGACGAGVSSLEPNPLVTDMGMFYYGNQSLEDLEGIQVLSWREGRSCNVLVTEHADGNRSLRVNGKVDASTSSDMVTQLGSAYFPRFIRPGATEVLVIGYGSGVTSGASLLFPGTEVVCCELEEEVAKASQYFAAVNHSPERSARFSLILDDGRKYMLGTARTFDLVISEPSNPWIAGVSSLFTQEFYQNVKHKLKENGVLVQWIQEYDLTFSEFALIVRTIRSVFSHCSLVRLSDGDILLLASTESIGPYNASINQSQLLVDSVPEIKSDLTRYYGTTDVRSLLLAYLILDDRGIDRLLAFDLDNAVNTDVNMRLEFGAPLYLFKKIPSEQQIGSTLLRACQASWFDCCLSEWGCNKTQLLGIKSLANLFAMNGFEDLSNELIIRGLRYSPTDSYFLAEQISHVPDIADVDLVEAIQKIAQNSFSDAASVGVNYWRQKRYRLAIVVFKHLTDRCPSSAQAWTNLGVNYEAFGDRKRAVESFEIAYRLDPLNSFVRECYEKEKALALPSK